MKIAHIIPYSIGYPLTTHNGRYEWVYDLAVAQAADGHTVTIYGNPDSVVPSVTTRGITTSSEDTEANNIATFQLAFREDHDVYHSHFDTLHYVVADQTDKPIVFTQHWWPNDQLYDRLNTSQADNVWAVPPTRYMLAIDEEHTVQTKGFIYHGVDLSLFRPTQTTPTDRVLFVGRIAPEKHLEIAIASAKAAGVGLDIIGKVSPKHQAYWESLRTEIDGEIIRYHGSQPKAALPNWYSAALGVVCPYEITEPFGLVSIEAQACGAPVLMQRGGSRGELLEEQRTGFLCETIEDYSAAIRNLAKLDREDCVNFAQKFDRTAMTRAYESLYESLR
jgi:glycosyltransferase involved in cell wall biosynthesis